MTRSNHKKTVDAGLPVNPLEDSACRRSDLVAIEDMVGSGKRVLHVTRGNLQIATLLREGLCSSVVDAGKALDESPVVRQVDVALIDDLPEDARDPEGFLARVRETLDVGGYLVASFPSVSHASIDLARLERDPRRAGGGDEPDDYLRGFTAESVDIVLRNSGFVVTELRRVYAESGDTVLREFGDPDSRPASALVDALAVDPDVLTDRFVVKAVPDDAAHAVEEVRQREIATRQDLRRREREIRVLGHEVQSTAQLVGVAFDRESADVPTTTVGVWGEFDSADFVEEIRVRVLGHEIRRRLPHARVRFFAPFGYERGNESRFGELVEPLGLLSAARRAELAESLDCIVSTGQLAASDVPFADRLGIPLAEFDGRSPTEFFTGGLGPEHERQCPFVSTGVTVQDDQGAAAFIQHSLADRKYVSVRSESDARRLRDFGVHSEIAVVPDPIIFASRIVSPSAAWGRVEYLVERGWYPDGRNALVVAGDDLLATKVAPLARQLRQVVASHELAVVGVVLPGRPGSETFASALAQALPGAFVLPSTGDVEDLVAAISMSQGVISSDPDALAIATACRVPILGLDLSMETDSPGSGNRRAAVESLASRLESLFGVAHLRLIATGLELVARGFERALLAHGSVPEVARLEEVLDTHFDLVVDMAHESARERHPEPTFSRVDQTRGLLTLLREYVEELRASNQHQFDRLVAERKAFASRIDRLAAERDEVIASLGRAEAEVAQLVELGETWAEAQKEVDAVRAEHAALLNTKMVRFMARPRRIYGKLRRRVRRDR